MPSRSKTVSTNTSAATSAVSSAYPSRASSPAPRKPFRFFDLPSELRLRIYEEVLVKKQPLDLDQLNYRLIHPSLALFLVSHRMHDEGYRVFYAQPIRLFPHHAHGRYFRTKKPLLARLPAHYREAVTTVEWCVGSGWTKPPPGQNTNPSLGLVDCTHMRKLQIFVELDPSNSYLSGFRGKDMGEETYKWFCVDVLSGILEQVPSLEVVEIDANPGVQRDTPLIMALRARVAEARVRLAWGPLRGWGQDGDTTVRMELASAMASMGLVAAPREVTAKA